MIRDCRDYLLLEDVATDVKFEDQLDREASASKKLFHIKECFREKTCKYNLALRVQMLYFDIFIFPCKPTIEFYNILFHYKELI